MYQKLIIILSLFCKTVFDFKFEKILEKVNLILKSRIKII